MKTKEVDIMYTDIQHELGKFVKLKSDESVHDVIKRDGLRKYKKKQTQLL